jgi:hypothetical protein
MQEASLDIFTLATAADACITIAEALDDKDLDKQKYLSAGKKIAEMVEQYIADYGVGVTNQVREEKRNELGRAG